MFEIIRGYKSYLERECRLPQDAVIHYLGNLPIILDTLDINSVQDINPGKVQDAWRWKRWEITEDGIQVSEKAEVGYLSTFKEFLVFLEKTGQLQRQGLAEMIRLPEAPAVRVRGLSKGEIARLKDFLRFNVSNNTRRRETALTWLLLETGARFSEAVRLNVHASGRILMESSGEWSGHFRVENNRVQVNFLDEEGEEITVALPDELVHYLNFYLENRKQTSPVLFLSDIRGNQPRRLKAAAAQRIVERVFDRAGIPVKKGRISEILQATAVERGIRKKRTARQILSLHDSENQNRNMDPTPATPGTYRSRNVA